MKEKQPSCCREFVADLSMTLEKMLKALNHFLPRANLDYPRDVLSMSRCTIPALAEPAAVKELITDFICHLLLSAVCFHCPNVITLCQVHISELLPPSIWNSWN
jgi:hypothetical protein